MEAADIFRVVPQFAHQIVHVRPSYRKNTVRIGVIIEQSIEPIGAAHELLRQLLQARFRFGAPLAHVGAHAGQDAVRHQRRFLACFFRQISE